MQHSFPSRTEGNPHFNHPMSSYGGDPYQQAMHAPDQMHTWQGSLPYNSPSQPGSMAPPFSGYHTTSSAWHQNYQQPMDDYYPQGQSRMLPEAPGSAFESDPRSHRGRKASRSKSHGLVDEEGRHHGPTAGTAASETSGRSSSKSKRSLAKSVYVDDMLAPKEPGTRPLSLRELADFDYNEKGRLVVKEHSTYGQPASGFLPRQSSGSRSRSPSPVPLPEERKSSVPRNDPAPPPPPPANASAAAPSTDSGIEELKAEVARLRAELQAQQEANHRRQSDEARALKTELERLQSRNDALSHRETKTTQQVALKEEELDLVRLRLEKIAQQMAEIRMHQCSRPRSERRALQAARSASQGAVPLSQRPRRTPPRHRLITAGPAVGDDWHGGSVGAPPRWPPEAPIPPEGTLLYRTVDEDGHEVEYREVAVIRHGPGDRRVISETYLEHPVKAAGAKYTIVSKTKSPEAKQFTDMRKEPPLKSIGVYDDPKAMLSFKDDNLGKRYDDFPQDDWEMPTSPTKPLDHRMVQPETGSPSKPHTKAGHGKGGTRRASSRGHGTKKKM